MRILVTGIAAFIGFAACRLSEASLAQRLVPS
jgi:nucleoside-diphosphate-sugar epimerase